MQKIDLHIKHEILPLREPFRISRGARTEGHVVTVQLMRDNKFGWGEATPYAHYGETTASVIEQIEQVRQALENGLTNDELDALLPAGAARNAVDCALWDLRAKERNTSVWQLLGLPKPRPVCTAVTIGVDTTEKMAAKAALYTNCPLLKVKLNRDCITEKITAIHEAAPTSRMIVDPNESWRIETVDELGGFLRSKGVALLEQPIPAASSDDLADVESSVPICADEACHTSADLENLVGKYHAINIKLDKTGGLTQAVIVLNRASELNFEVMVGCMIGSSLAMAPATLIASSASYVDLDGPAWLASDREHGLSIDNGIINAPTASLWGGAAP